MNYLADAWFSFPSIFLYSSPLLQTGNGLESSRIWIKSRVMISPLLLFSNIISMLDSSVHTSLAGTETSVQKHGATWMLPFKYRLYHVKEGCNSNRSLVTENFLRCLHFSISCSECCAMQYFHLLQYKLNSQIEEAFNGFIQDSVSAHHYVESYSLLSCSYSIIFCLFIWGHISFQQQHHYENSCSAS